MTPENHTYSSMLLNTKKNWLVIWIYFTRLKLNNHTKKCFQFQFWLYKTIRKILYNVKDRLLYNLIQIAELKRVNDAFIHVVWKQSVIPVISEYISYIRFEIFNILTCCWIVQCLLLASRVTMRLCSLCSPTFSVLFLILYTERSLILVSC